MKLRSLSLAVVAAAPLWCSAQKKTVSQANLPDAPSAKVTSVAVPVFTTAKIANYEVPQPGAEPLRLTLDDAIGIAIKNNTQMQIDAQNLRAVGGLKLTALNALIPSLSVEAQTSTQEINLAAMGLNFNQIRPLLPPGYNLNTIVKVDTTSAQANLSQQLFNLPAFEVYRASDSASKTALYNFLLTRGDVTQRVATQYLQVLADVERIHNAQAQQKSDIELERQSDEKHKAGVGTNLDYLRARVERQQRDQELISAQNDFDKDKIELNRLMGIPADQAIELTDAIPYYEIEQLPIDEAKRVAAQHRKDLLSLQAQLRTAELQRKAIKYERFPTAKVSGFYGVLGETRGLYHGIFNAQGSIDFPIFEEARIRGDKEKADALLDSLRIRVRSLNDDIDEQIRSAKLDVDSYSELVKVARSNVALAQEALQDTNDRYRSGIDDNLPVVQAQATLADAQAQLVASMFQFNQAKLQLARTIGVVESQFDNYLRR